MSDKKKQFAKKSLYAWAYYGCVYLSVQVATVVISGWQSIAYYALKIMTESVKTGLICTKYTYSFYHIYLFFCVGYTISVSFTEFRRKLCVYDEIFDTVLC